LGRTSKGHTESSFSLRSWRQDGQAGLVNAVISVPDGLAAAALAGVNPVYGLYTSITAPVAGSLLASAQLMQIATTSAAALAAGQAVATYPQTERDGAMFLLGVLTGLFLLVFALLRAGRLVRYVSHAVMTGFLFGVSAVLVLDQLAPLVGYVPQGRNEIVQFLDLVANLGGWDWRTIIVGSAALVIMVALARTAASTLSSLIALVLPTVAVALLGWTTVEQVADVSPIPRGLPALSLPDPTLLTPDLVLAGFALAVVVGIQGAGVSQSVDNRDGTPVSASRDLLAQGAGNLAAGLFSGIPAGGSVGQTALNVAVGARGRWSGIFAGLWMLVIVLLLPGVVGLVPMTVLAALMIVAGIGAIDVREALSIWRTAGAARWGITVTFLATLTLSVPVAVAVGVGLTVVLFLLSSASDITVRRLHREGTDLLEGDPPAALPDGEVVVLTVYGSLFFAGARTLAEQLPAVGTAKHPAVILRMRGRTQVGATLIDVLDHYADDLAAAGGRLSLSGLHPDVAEQLRRSGKLTPRDDVHLYEASATVAGSTQEAWSNARRWLRITDRAPERAGHGQADSHGHGHEEAPRAPVLPSGLSRPHP
jgi:SulP family sulfate permease